MMLVLLVAGIGFVLAGIVAVLFGIPVKEFSFGNTLILVGVLAVCTGMIMVGLSAIVRELKLIARRVGPRSAAEPRARDFLPSPAVGAAAPDLNFPFVRDKPADAEPTESDASPIVPPWQDATAARGQQEAPAEPDAPQGGRQRRNLLFTSTLRKDRERAQGRAAGPSAPPGAESGEAPPPNFDDPWPKADRARPPEWSRRPGRTPFPNSSESNAPAGPADRPPSPARDEDQAAVTVLKSGVVDGMAYSLYSDGSIEAQMPEGMMRFSSIDELRAHLDQRS